MAPNFLSKFVKHSPQPVSPGLSRSPSPSPANRYPTIAVSTTSPTSPEGARPRRHTTTGSATPSDDGASDLSGPNVTVVPPSPRSVSQNSLTDENTPRSARPPAHSPAQLNNNNANGSAKSVPSLSNLNSPAPLARGAPSPQDEEGLVTPTPAGRTSFADQGADQGSLSHSRSTGNLREKAQGSDIKSPNHPRSATMVDDKSRLPTPDDPNRAPSRKSSKTKLRVAADAAKEDPSRRQSQSRHDRSASVPSYTPNVTVTEDGVLTTSPVSESPPAIIQSSPSKRSLAASATVPNVASNFLMPDNSDAVSVNSVGSNTPSSKKKRSWRRKSSNNGTPVQPATSPAASSASLSPKRKPTGSKGLVSAIAASGMTMANHGMSMAPFSSVEMPPTPGTSSTLSSVQRPRRSSSFSRVGRSRNASLSYPTSDLSDHESFRSGLDGASGEDDEDDDLDLDPDDIPVTGFAVASNRRNQEFHELFPKIPEGDYLIEDYGCALQREILAQGRIYISENHICFHANILGWITDLTIPMYDVIALDKRMTAFVIPNAILVTTVRAKYTFTSFLSRDNTFDVIYNVWRLARPEGSSMGSRMQSPRGSLDMPNDVVSDGVSMTNGASSGSTVDKTSGKGQGQKNKVTRCACGKAGEHFSEKAMESIVPGTPEKIYNLMFTSGFIKDFMRDDEKLTDIQISDWMPTAENSKLLFRQMSYTKPLSGGIGPKSTKCELRDDTLHCDFDDYISTLTTTRTPDVPSGNVFSVKTRTCITWASSVSSKILVTTQVEWTGRSFIKGIIEKSAIDGQKIYHADLDRCMRDYIHAHQSEFIPEGVDASVVEEVDLPVIESPQPESVERPLTSETGARKSREFERNQRGLQWAYDTFEGTLKVARQSAEGLLELIKDAWEQSSSTTILYFVIVFLVISNIWTLMMVGKREEVGRRKEMRKIEEREKWVQGVVTALWEELTTSRNGNAQWPPPVHLSDDWRGEIAEISSVLDTVEERVHNLRLSLKELD
ncbi:hypothetical protein AcW2_000108 [Taiwanofungus camphoratus]|nr:hypothetical protein AcW2_000108 [Antrodia cinnamomea]